MLIVPLRSNAELRVLEPHHGEEFLAHLDRARAHIAPWVGARFVATDLDEARAVLQRYADGTAADRTRLYGIWLDGVLVGGTMYVSFDAAIGVCEIGCWLEPAAEGQGLITQVVRMMIDWAFRTRGLVRAEWRPQSGNTPSINVAKRLGMSLDGTLRQQVQRPDGSRRDLEVWSVLADDWPAAHAASDGADADADVKTELDQLMAAFLGAFTNTGGGRPNVDVIRQVFVPDGRIVMNAGPEPVSYDLDAFIAPREKILTDGTLTEFTEWETAERTEIAGAVAHRFSHYRKSGFHHGERFEGAGYKTIQFVRTPAGWRMSAMAWDDVPA